MPPVPMRDVSVCTLPSFDNSTLLSAPWLSTAQTAGIAPALSVGERSSSNPTDRASAEFPSQNPADTSHLSTIGSAPCDSARRVSVISPVQAPRFVIPAHSAASPAISFRVALLSAVFRDTLSRSKSISGADSPPKSATSAIRRRRWGTPQNCASSTR